MNYKDPRWQRKRCEILMRDGFRCVRCGRGDYTLHVHHKKYSDEPWETASEDLQTLCEPCHEKLGRHPRGGIWWIDESGWGYSHCPMCGSEDTRNKGNYDKCNSCGHRIIPAGLFDE
jgi:hypothetical protein